jgi:hypothetical protein
MALPSSRAGSVVMKMTCTWSRLAAGIRLMAVATSDSTPMHTSGQWV